MLDGGKIIERGTHETLADAGGLYSAFAREQSAKTDLEAIDVEAVAE